MIAIGVDPGKVTGLAWWNSDTNVFHSEETSAPDTVLSCMMNVHSEKRLILGCERFTPRGNSHKMTAQPDALHVIGQVKSLCGLYRNVTWRLQPPSTAKRLTTDATLRRLGWYTPTKDKHANDAARHLMLILLTLESELAYGMLHPDKVVTNLSE